MNLQPHLGTKIDRNYKPHDNMGGYMALARIIKVHHKNNTADVEVVKDGEIISSSEVKEGKYSARIATATASFNKDLMSSSGVVEPMQEGQYVILAFLDGLRNQPIIISSFHDTWTPERNVLTDQYPLKPEKHIDDYREALKYLRVFPSQMFHHVDGIGGMEFSHPSKTFMKMDADLYSEMSDSHEGFDHENLSVKDPRTQQTRSGNTEESSFPVNMLFAHRSSFDPKETTWTKFFLGAGGMFRTTRDNHDGTLTYTEFSEEGDFTIRRQTDSHDHGTESNYSELKFSKDGSFEVTVDDGEGASTISLNKDRKLLLKQGEGTFIEMDNENGDINLEARGDVNIKGANGGAGIYVGDYPPLNAPDNTFWLDTSRMDKE